MNKEIYASDLAIQHGATLIKTNNDTIEYLKKYFEEKDYFFAFFNFKNKDFNFSSEYFSIFDKMPKTVFFLHNFELASFEDLKLAYSSGIVNGLIGGENTSKLSKHVLIFSLNEGKDQSTGQFKTFFAPDKILKHLPYFEIS